MRATVLGMASVLCIGMASPAFAGDPLADEIVKALTGGNKVDDRQLTRSLGKVPLGSDKSFTPRSFTTGKSSEESDAMRPVKGTLLIQSGNGSAQASGPVVQGAASGTPQADAPKLSYDLYVTFPFASHTLTAEAKQTLGSLAEALNHPGLVDKRIMIAGHTDSVGDDDSNMELSEKRAAEVRDFLWSEHRIDRNRIVTVGYGETRLKDPNQPTSGVNRRVELVNMGETVASAD